MHMRGITSNVGLIQTVNVTEQLLMLKVTFVSSEGGANMDIP